MPQRQRRLGHSIALLALTFIGATTLIPAPAEVARAALTPLACILCGELGSVDFLLNTMLFLPLGIGLSLAGFSWRRILVLAGIATFTIELLQMKVIAGRDASLGDLVANSLGAGLGSALGADWRRFVLPNATSARRLALASMLTLLWIWAGTAWALGPAFPQGAPWYGAWAPELENYEPFLGRPILVSAGGEVLLPGGPALDQQRLEDAVSARPSMAFTAVLAEPPHDLAPIGMIMDGRQRNVMLIGQDGPHLVFQLSMRAGIVELRTPTVQLRGGLAGLPGDTVEGAGALRDGAFELSSSMHGQAQSRRLPLSASWGWALVTPWEAVLGKGTHALTALWIAGLVAVLVYWSALAGGMSLVFPPVTMILLFVGIPLAADFPPVHWSEWAAALAGALLGILASRPAFQARAKSNEPGYNEEPPMRPQVTS